MSDDEPGDAVCWLPQLCPECGAMPTGEQPERCWRCGAELPDNSVEDAPRPP
jgi:predicted amidophosphoribosyltransferase